MTETQHAMTLAFALVGVALMIWATKVLVRDARSGKQIGLSDIVLWLFGASFLVVGAIQWVRLS